MLTTFNLYRHHVIIHTTRRPNRDSSCATWHEEDTTVGEDYPKYSNENLVKPRIGQMQETNADK